MRRAAKHSTGNELPRDALAWLRDEEPRDGKGKRSSGEGMSGGGTDKQRTGYAEESEGKAKQGRGFATRCQARARRRCATHRLRNDAKAQESDAWSRTALA